MTAMLKCCFMLVISLSVMDTSYTLPLTKDDDVISRSKRSLPHAICARKTRLTQASGIISSYRTLHDQDVSCSWVIHARRGHHVQLTFIDLKVKDDCPGICACNYVMIKEPIAGKKEGLSRKYCNERQPSGNDMTNGSAVRIHLRLKPGTTLANDGFTISYTTILGGNTPPVINPTSIIPLEEMSELDTIKGEGIEETFHSEDDHGYARLREMSPTPENYDVTTTSRDSPEEETGPSKMTVLLGVAIPVVMIFIFVVLLIAYYNHVEEMKQQQASESPSSGTHISDMILNSGATLAPMINLRKAKRESSRRREKANKLYDDMLQSWKATNECRKERLKAKQESVNVWESYQASKKHRRSNSRDVREESKAFAMLVSNAINVTDPEEEEEKEPEFEEKPTPRPSSILIMRNSSDEIPHKRNSKVLSWSDLSMKSKEEKIPEKRSTSAGEITAIQIMSPLTSPIQITTPDDVTTPVEPESKSSGYIPAIVVSQPSFESEESEANDTDRLIKDDKKDGGKPEASKIDVNGAKATYSCSDHVKDILRDSYGEEVDEWWQKPKKSASQGSLKASPDSKVKYTAVNVTEDDID